MKQEDLCRPKFTTYDRLPRKHICPMCRRRVKMRIRENCCGETYYTMPPHKPRNWYKEKKI